MKFGQLVTGVVAVAAGREHSLALAMSVSRETVIASYGAHGKRLSVEILPKLKNALDFFEECEEHRKRQPAQEATSTP